MNTSCWLPYARFATVLQPFLLPYISLSTIACGHFWSCKLTFWNDASHCLWHSGTDLGTPRSRISVFPEVYTAQSPVWRLVPSALPPLVFSRHLVETPTALIAPIWTEIGYYSLESVVRDAWFSRSCVYRLVVNKSEHELEHDINPP